jgi:hypothetical protein
MNKPFPFRTTMGKLQSRYISVHSMRRYTQEAWRSHKQSQVCQFRYLDSTASRGNYSFGSTIKHSNRPKYSC